MNRTDLVSAQIKYRPDIDGLRAVAILSVIFYHAFPNYCKGGFIGVDIFFVISGFLISGIVFHQSETGDFSFSLFYLRRIKRLFPSLILVLFSCLLLGWFILLPDDYTLLGKNILGSAGFFANFVLWRDSGYFNVDREFSPVAHLWSLGIEEQFYLFWPGLIVLFWHRHRLKFIITILLFVSFSLNYLLIDIKPSATFYFPVTRFWELLLGSLLAWIEFKNTRLFALFAESMAWLGAILIVLALMFINNDSAFPGTWALLPTIGAFLIIAAGPETWFSHRLLANQLFIFIGLISYPLYLWHWPILAFIKNEYGSFSLLNTCAAIFASFILAWLTFRWIEFPIRFGKFSQIKLVFLIFAMITVGLLGGLIMKNKIINHRFDAQRHYLQYFNKNTPNNYFIVHDILSKYKDECSFANNETRTIKATIPSYCFTATANKKIFLWGDSHAQQLNFGLTKALPNNISLLQVATTGCKPSLPDHHPDKQAACNISNNYALKKIDVLKPDVVIIAQVNGHERNHWGQLIAALKNKGIKHIIIMGPVPSWELNLNKIIARNYWQTTPYRISKYLDKDVMRTEKIMKAKFSTATAEVQYVSVIENVCDKNGCIAYLAGDRKDGIFTLDNGHLTPIASDYVVKKILMPVIMKCFT